MLKNLTPHDVVLTLLGADGQFSGEKKIFEKTGKEARLREKNVAAAAVDGFPCVKKEYLEIENLPEPEQGTFFIVSVIVLPVAKAMGRTDCLSPDTGPESVVRDVTGKIVGVKRFQC